MGRITGWRLLIGLWTGRSGWPGVHTVRLSCFSLNEKVVELYQRLKSVREGVAREAYYFDLFRVWISGLCFRLWIGSVL